MLQANGRQSMCRRKEIMDNVVWDQAKHSHPCTHPEEPSSAGRSLSPKHRTSLWCTAAERPGGTLASAALLRSYLNELCPEQHLLAISHDGSAMRQLFDHAGRVTGTKIRGRHVGA